MTRGLILVLWIFTSTTTGKITPYRTTITTSDEIQSEYDFIIVGGGSAGSLLASRLSEIPQWKILLVEAGEDEAYLSDVPGINVFLQNTHFTWKFKNQPQSSACLAYKKNQCNAPRGKVLGGTGVLNNMVYSRCHRKDYDEWASMGNPGWSFEEVLPFFKKSERMKIPEYMNSPYHGTKGELHVERLPFKTKLAETFLEAGRELGYKTVDYNTGDNEGFSLLQVNMIKGTRCSGNRAFLSKASRRSNLDVVILAQVKKILIDPSTKLAQGVEFLKTNNKRKFKVSARNEIILSAGVFNSPKLLMLSGIGPKDHLREIGIPLIKDLPVGQTIRDHYGFIASMFTMNTSIGLTWKKVANVNTLIKYFNHDGYLTMPGTEAIGFVKTKYAMDERPDIELVLIPSSTTVEINVLRTLGLKDDYVQKYYASVLSDANVWSLSVFLLRPNSTGCYRLKSKDPFDDPIIEGNFFSHRGDIDVLIEGIKQGVKLSDTKAFAKYNSKIVQKNIPGCEDHKFGSDQYWECAIRHLTIEVHHQMGTCQMGPKSDKTSVVDHRLRVHGICGLRIADTSIIPLQLSGHPNAPTYMIAEKAADMIKSDWL